MHKQAGYRLDACAEVKNDGRGVCWFAGATCCAGDQAQMCCNAHSLQELRLLYGWMDGRTDRPPCKLRLRQVALIHTRAANCWLPIASNKLQYLIVHFQQNATQNSEQHRCIPFQAAQLLDAVRPLLE